MQEEILNVIADIVFRKWGSISTQIKCDNCGKKIKLIIGSENEGIENLNKMVDKYGNDII